jgi:hypothetical protein
MKLPSYVLELKIQTTTRIFSDFPFEALPSSVNKIPKNPCALKGKSHEKVGELRVWGVSLGPKLRAATGF